MAERLLAVFDQHLKVAGDEHFLDIDEGTYPEEYRQVIRWLNRAITEPKIRQTMDVEDDILAELEDKERRIMGMSQALEGKDKALEEKDKALKKKDKTLEENAKALEEKDRLIAELRKP